MSRESITAKKRNTTTYIKIFPIRLKPNSASFTAIYLLAAALPLAGAVASASAQTIIYEQSANGQFLDPSTDGDSHYEPTNSDWSQETTYGTDRNNKTFLNSIGNWTTPTYPGSASVAVSIDLPVTLDVSPTLGSGGSVTALNGITLTTAGGLMINNDTFTLTNVANNFGLSVN